MSNIWDETFCENRLRLKTINYFRKILHLRCLTGFWMRLWNVESCWKLTRISWLHGFSVSISRYYKDDYASSLFPPTIRLWNSLLADFFPLTYDLNCIKSRVNRHLSIFQIFFIPVLLYVFHLCLVVLVILRPVVAVQPCLKSTSFKKKIKVLE